MNRAGQNTTRPTEDTPCQSTLSRSRSALPDDRERTRASPWTLTTLFGEFLHEAEERFGARDMTYTPLGLEFDGAAPHLWFPGDRHHISIVLTEAARFDPAEALFELAHETVHMLAPTSGRSEAPVFEEGLATLFAHEKSQNLRLNKAASDPN